MLISRQTNDPSGAQYLKVGEGWLRAMEQSGLHTASRNGVIDGFLIQAKKFGDQGKVLVLAPSTLVAIAHLDSAGLASAFIGVVPPAATVKTLISAGGLSSTASVNRLAETAKFAAPNGKPIWAWATAVPKGDKTLDATSIVLPTYAVRDDRVVNGSVFNMNYYNPTTFPDPAHPGFSVEVDAYPVLVQNQYLSIEPV